MSWFEPTSYKNNWVQNSARAPKIEFITCWISEITTWANEMNFVMNHAPGAGSIARPVGQQSSALPLYHGCPPPDTQVLTYNRYLDSLNSNLLVSFQQYHNKMSLLSSTHQSIRNNRIMGSLYRTFSPTYTQQRFLDHSSQILLLLLRVSSQHQWHLLENK